MAPRTPAPEQGQHAFPEPVGLLQVRVPGQDELGDPRRVVLLDALGDLGVAADQRGARATAHQADTGPQVRVHLQAVLAAVQRDHPPLPLRAAAGESFLHARDGGRVEHVEQPLRLGPRLVGAVAADHVQPHAEPRFTAQRRRLAPDPGDLLRDLVGRLTPGEVDVGVPGGHPAGGGRRAAEVDLRHRVGRAGERGVFDGEVRIGEVDPLAAPQRPHDGQELVRAPVPGLLVEEVAVRPLLVVLSASTAAWPAAARG